MTMTRYAPVMVSTYSRLEHLKQTIAALQKNTLAMQSELYIFSDDPKAGDEAIVANVRTFIQTVDGFKKVHIIERETNGRIANSRGGLEELLRSHGKAIILEDDIVTAPGFLQFMNDCLDRYEDQEDVLSVCGYTPPLDIPSIESDVIPMTRCLAWGFGIWAEKYQKIVPVTPEDYKDILHCPENLHRLNTEYGNDLIHSIKAESNGHLDGLDVKSSHLLYKKI